MKLRSLLEIEYGVHDMLKRHMDQIKLDSGPNTYRMLQTQLALGKDAEVENWLIKHGYEEEKLMPFEEQMLNEEPKDGVDGVKPGSIKKTTDAKGRKIAKYIKVSKKGRETPMIFYYDDPSDKKNEPKDDEGVKKYPFIGYDNQYEVQKFDIDSEAEKLYKSLQNTMVDKGINKNSIDFLRSLRRTAIANDEIFFLRVKAENDKKASKAMVKCCEDLLKYIHRESGMKDAVRMHKYLDKHINLVKETYKKNPREDKKDDCFDMDDLDSRSKNKLRFKLGGQTFGARNPAPTYESKISLISLIKEEIDYKLSGEKNAEELAAKTKQIASKAGEEMVNLAKDVYDTPTVKRLRAYVKQELNKLGQKLVDKYGYEKQMKIPFPKDEIDENLRNWFKKEKWKRIDTQGNIKGDCGTMPKGKKTQRCLPAAKAKSLTKKQRAATSRKKTKSNKQFVSNTKAAKVKLKK